VRAAAGESARGVSRGGRASAVVVSGGCWRRSEPGPAQILSEIAQIDNKTKISLLLPYWASLIGTLEGVWGWVTEQQNYRAKAR